MKAVARVQLKRALADGLISKPEWCEDCRAKRALHGHHGDYSDPLNVRWLCPQCHGLRHRRPTTKGKHVGKVKKVISEYMAGLARKRARSLTAERRQEIARAASLARWGKRNRKPKTDTA